jgi:hypothetical protein
MFTRVGIFSAMIGDDMSETVGASTMEKGAGLYDETAIALAAAPRSSRIQGR